MVSGSDDVKKTNDTATAKDDNGDGKPSRRDYLKFRETLDQYGRDASGSFDKHLLTLSSGAVGLSVLFLDKIISTSGAKELWLLIASWTALVICINFLLASRASDIAIDSWDEDYVSGANREKVQDDGSLRSTITCLNWISCVTFILGVILLCAFAAVNLQEVTVLK